MFCGPPAPLAVVFCWQCLVVFCSGEVVAGNGVQLREHVRQGEC